MIYPIPQATPGMAYLQKGDVLSGRVIEHIGPFQYRIRFFGQETTVNSRVPLKQGQKLLLKIEDFTPRLKLKLLSAQYPTSQKISQYASLLQELGLKSDVLSVAILNHFLRLKIPIRKKEIQTLRQEMLPLGSIIKADTDTLLMPVGIWYHLMPREFLEYPQFLFRWVWGMSKKKKENEASSGEQNAQPDEITGILKEIHQGIQIDTFMKTWPQLGVEILLELYRSSKNFDLVSKENYFKFKFLDKQVKRFQLGQWAMFPFRWKNQENFLYVRQLNKKVFRDIIIEFSIPGPGKPPTEVRTHIKERTLQVEFWNEDQAYRQKVEHSLTSFLRKMHETTNFKIIDVKENPVLKGFQGLTDYFKEIRLKTSGVIDGPSSY